MINPLISVIFPVYNVESYVEKSIKSLIDQSYVHLEILVVLGKSTDRSTEICENVAETDNRIKLIYQTGRGLSDARILGFNEASGDYIACLDSDDSVDLDAYSKIVSKIEQFSPDCVVFGWAKEFVDHEEKYVPKLDDGLYGENAISKIFSNMLISKDAYNPVLPYCAWCKIFKAYIIKNNLNLLSSSLRYREDVLSSTVFLVNCNSIYLMQSESFVRYLYREESLVNQVKKGLTESDIELYSRLNSFAEEHVFLQHQIYLIFINYIVESIFNVFRSLNLSDTEKKEEVIKILNLPMTMDVVANANVKGLPLKIKIKKYCLKHRKLSIFKLLFKINR